MPAKKLTYHKRTDFINDYLTKNETILMECTENRSVMSHMNKNDVKKMTNICQDII